MILKRSIVASFITWFLMTLGAIIALLSLLDINLFDVKTSWLTLTVSAVLTLVYASFFLLQYGEEKSRLTQDIDKILNNEKPELLWEFLKNISNLDIEKLKKDMNNPKIDEIIKQDREDATIMGVRGTPTIFVNGVELTSLSPKALFNLVEKEIYK